MQNSLDLGLGEQIRANADSRIYFPRFPKLQKTYKIYLIPSSSTPKITSCPKNMSKYVPAVFQYSKSKRDKQRLQHKFFSLVNRAERPWSRVNKILLLR